jgi:hypothetical protein
VKTTKNMDRDWAAYPLIAIVRALGGTVEVVPYTREEIVMMSTDIVTANVAPEEL